MKKNVVLWVLISLLSSSLISQTIVRQVISPIGVTTNVNGNYISHTVGQPTPPGTSHTSNVILRQGFEQPPKGKAVITTPLSVSINIFPNPNDGTFYLNVETKGAIEYTYDIFDAIGKLIMSGDGVGNVEKLISLPFGSGRSIYIIKIKTSSGLLADGKIIVIG
jgi:hypothetical protein